MNNNWTEIQALRIRHLAVIATIAGSAMSATVSVSIKQSQLSIPVSPGSAERLKLIKNIPRVNADPL
jgi:hypothetical protein